MLGELPGVAEGLGLAIEEEEYAVASEGDGGGNGDDGDQLQDLALRREEIGRRLSQDRERRCEFTRVVGFRALLLGRRHRGMKRMPVWGAFREQWVICLVLLQASVR